MKIVIDGRMLYWPGVGRYTKALLDNLEQIDRDNEYLVLTRPSDASKWMPKASNFRRIEVDINPYTIPEQTRLGGTIRALKPDLVHFTAANAPVAYRGPKIVTVHDLTLLDFDTSRGAGIGRQVRRMKRFPFRQVLKGNVRSARAVITPSQYVKDQVVGRFGLDPSRVHVTPLAADKNLAEAESLERLGITGQFILFVGSVYPYKNVGLIIQAMARLGSTWPDLKLVLTAAPDYFRELLLMQAQKLGLADRVVFTGFVSDGELVSLYQKAAVYVYPSLSEGFGLQGLEAMAQGLPVIAAHSCSLPEVCGNAAEYFDPHSAGDLAATIDRVLSSTKLQDDLKKLGQVRYQQFSWRRTAEQTLAIYRGQYPG